MTIWDTLIIYIHNTPFKMQNRHKSNITQTLKGDKFEARNSLFELVGKHKLHKSIFPVSGSFSKYKPQPNLKTT